MIILIALTRFGATSSSDGNQETVWGDSCGKFTPGADLLRSDCPEAVKLSTKRHLYTSCGAFCSLWFQYPLVPVMTLAKTWGAQHAAFKMNTAKIKMIFFMMILSKIRGEVESGYCAASVLHEISRAVLGSVR